MSNSAVSGKVTVIGSSNTDLIIKTHRIPSPGETILGGDFNTANGGKGANQAVAAARLGADVTFIARIGSDNFGDCALELLIKEKINTDYVYRDQKTPSGIAIIIVDDDGENSIVIAGGSNLMLSPADIHSAKNAITESSILLMQLETPLDTIEYAARTAHDAGVTVILNPAPACMLDENLLKTVDIITPNKSEASLLSGIDVYDTGSAKEAAEIIRKKGDNTVVMTMGSEGALVVSDEMVKTFPPTVIEPVDTTAAGDAFNGALASQIAQGKLLKEAVVFANNAGALTATKMGAQPSLPTLEEVENFMKHSGK